MRNWLSGATAAHTTEWHVLTWASSYAYPQAFLRSYELTHNTNSTLWYVRACRSTQKSRLDEWLALENLHSQNNGHLHSEGMPRQNTTSGA